MGVGKGAAERVRGKCAATCCAIRWQGIVVSVLLGLAVGACVASRAERSTPPQASAADADIDWAQLRVEPASRRTLEALDLSDDGRIDAADWKPLFALSESAAQALEQRDATNQPRRHLYGGPGDEKASVFKKVQNTAAALTGAGADVEWLQAVTVEARWMAQQARLAHAAGFEHAAAQQLLGGLLQDQLDGYRTGQVDASQLCKLVDDLPQQIFDDVPADLPTTVVLDLDSTVWDGNVMDPFLAVLVEHSLIKPQAHPRLKQFLKNLRGVPADEVDANDVQNNARWLLDIYTGRAPPGPSAISNKDMFYLIVGLLEGTTPAEAQRAAKLAYTSGAGPYPAWQSRIFADSQSSCSMRTVIETLQEDGVHVYLLSATLDVLAWEAGHLLGVPEKRVLGSLLEIHNGRYTGEVRDSTYYTKGAIVRQWLAAPPILVFGDSPWSDASMMREAFGGVFMINPRPSLEELDEKKAGGQWAAVWFDQPAAATRQQEN